MVTRAAMFLLCALVVISSGSAEELRLAPRPRQLSICTLLQAQHRYARAFVEIHGAMLTNGIDSVAIGDPGCKAWGAIRIGEPQSGANHESLERLFDTVQLAYLSSTKTFRVMVAVTLVGTFYPSRSGARPEIRPREVASMRLVKGESLVPSIPSRRRRQ